MIRLAPFLLLASLLGCWGGDDPPHYRSDPSHPTSFGDGRILIAWTIAGQPPTQSSCGDVDHLTLNLAYGGQFVEISPIPCTLTRFRYDGLPSGFASLTLVGNGYGASGCTALSGDADLSVSPTLPTDPAPVLPLVATACQ